jgi:hypothetical protein
MPSKAQHLSTIHQWQQVLQSGQIGLAEFLMLHDKDFQKQIGAVLIPYY